MSLRVFACCCAGFAGALTVVAAPGVAAAQIIEVRTSVLASLLLNAGRVTLTGTLIGALWTEPPASGKAQLHNMVSRVRRRLRVALVAELAAERALATEADERIPHDLVRPSTMDIPEPPATPVRITRERPGDWLDAERRTLALAVDQACRLGLADVAGALALRLSGS